MKKFTLLLVTAIAFLSSCNNDNGDYWYSDEISVAKTRWELIGEVNDINSYYQYIYENRAIDSKMYNYGTIDVCLYEEDKINGGEIQCKLPYTQYFGEGNMLWSRTIDFDYAIGSIAIYVKESDFITRYRPEPMLFRVVMHRPD